MFSRLHVFLSKFCVFSHWFSLRLGLATMKINKNKLKNMVEKEAPVVMTGLKRKKVDEV